MTRKFKASYRSRIQCDLVRERLLDSGSVAFQCGLQGNPIQIDADKFLSDPAAWRDAVDVLVCRADEAAIPFDAVAGSEGQSAMLAQAVSYRIGLPALPVSLKGEPSAPAVARGKRVLVVLDFTVCGGKVAKAAEALRAAGAEVTDAVCIARVGPKATDVRLQESGITLHKAICGRSLVAAARERGLIDEGGEKRLAAYLSGTAASCSIGK